MSKLVPDEILFQSPFLLFIGDELYQQDTYQKRLRGYAAQAKGTFETFDGAQWSQDSERFRESASVPDLFSMGGPKWLWVRRAERSNLTLSELTSSSDTRFCLQYSKLEKKKIPEFATVIECREPYPREWGSWKKALEKESGLEIEGEAWERLGALLNFNLALCVQELEKARSYTAGPLDCAALDEVLAANPSLNPFDLADAIVERDRKNCIRLLLKAKELEESDLKLWGLILRQFRLVQGLLIGAREGRDPKGVAVQLGISSYFISKVVRQSSFYELSSFERVLSLLSQTDYRLKTGDHEALFALVEELSLLPKLV